MRPRLAAAVMFVLVAACGTPSAPPPPKPPVVGPATPPVIRQITVPTSRVEAGQTISIAATVEDAETPLSQLAYQWAASAGTITGSGTTATWTMPEGITAGVNVAITLTVVDTYDAVVNNQVVKQQFTVVGTSPAFRVHDSEAETMELGRKFLVDLFGNSSVPPESCMVDFSDTCATADNGKIEELQQIVEHRQGYVVISAEVLKQRVAWRRADFGSVHTAMLYRDRPINSMLIGTTCGDFEVTVVYVGNRWWICQSFYNEGDTSGCPSALNNGGVGRVMRKGGGVRK